MTLSSATLEHAGFEEALDAYYDRGWTDGLPVVPPSVPAVEAMVAATGLAPETVLGEVPTRDVAVTVEKVAINAVMAGCLPAHAPVVVAAVQALLDPLANAHSTTATMAGAAHAVVVNGPVRGEIGLACGQGALGPGFRPNATIGRALRLVVRNVLGAVPGALDRASFSSPLRYSFCFGENEEHSTWTPLHVLLGHRPQDSVVSLMPIHQLLPADEFSPEADDILATVAATARLWGVTRDGFVGDARSVMVVVGEEHHRLLLEAGWTKEAVAQRLYELMAADTTGRHDNQVVLAGPENVLVVAAGGPGMPQTLVLLPHLAAVTRAVVAA